MITYITLFNFTEQGTKNIKQTATRARSFRESVEAEGIKVIAQYWTAGAYDGVIILQGETEAKVLRCIAALAALGNVRPQSMRAFDGDEFKAVVG